MAYYDPPGVDFVDRPSGRRMKLVTAGHSAGWICYQHPDGQWVRARRATADDLVLWFGPWAGHPIRDVPTSYLRRLSRGQPTDWRTKGLVAWLRESYLPTLGGEDPSPSAPPIAPG